MTSRNSNEYALGSPLFTPTNRDKPLPSIDTAGSPATLFQTPTLWHAPVSESPLQEAPLQKLYNKSKSFHNRDQSQESLNSNVIDERLRQTKLESFSESPLSYNSSSQSDSMRYSCSTLASSDPHTGSQGSVTTSPYSYGFALGSPNKDKSIAASSASQEGTSQSNPCDGPLPIGLGLTEERVINAPFSHHRRPSWTLQNMMQRNHEPTTAASSAQMAEQHISNMPTPPMTVPSRNLSKSSKLICDEAAVPFPIRSTSTNSITSTTADSSFSQVSPRSSSLKKTKARQKLLSKASEPILTTLASPTSLLQTNRAKAGSVGETQRLYHGWTQGDADGTAGSSSTMRELHDYLAYAADNTMDLLPASPVVKSKVMAEEGILIWAEGVTLDELEGQAGSKTTHLLLSGCIEEGLVGFLDRVLPIVGQSLIVLDISKTRLTHLPDSIIHCSIIEELNISSIAFSRPWKCHALSRLSTLRTLLADSCQFVVLPAEIAQLRMLKTLSLQHNCLSHLPSWMHRLNLLQQLHLDGNPFQGSWQQICEDFVKSKPSIISTRPEMERAPESAPGRMDSSEDPPFEAYEEMADEMPLTAPNMRGIKSKEEKMRPLMKRMASSSSVAPLDDTAESMNISTLLLKSRRPSNGVDGGEKKWGSLMRKLGRKTSVGQMSPSTNSPKSSSPVKPRSFSLQQRQTTMVIQPLNSMAWQKSSGYSSSSSSPIKANSFHGIAEGQQGNKIHTLWQYLKDLDDLSAFRLGPPGTVLAMETSMASKDSFSSKDISSTTNRSGSETSRESIHSTSSSSIISQLTSDQSDRGTSAAQLMIKDDAQRRIRILQEIIATEESYIRGLQELIDIYVEPSAVIDSSSGQSTIPLTERRSVFANIEGIFHFHQSAFLPALQQATQAIINVTFEEKERQQADIEAYNAMTAKITEQVAIVFCKHAAYFRMYTAYVNNVEAAHKRVAIWKMVKMSESGNIGSATITNDGSISSNLSPKEKKRIKAFLQRAKLDPRHSQLSLETYLHLPVQRIPRYRLLFEDLIRTCPSFRLQDPNAITKALDSICSIATQMNESKRQSENDRKLLEWQARIKGQFASPLLQPHRRLILDGNLILKKVVMRTTAFHLPRSQWLEEECLHSTQCDGAVTDTDLGIVQIDCLDQRSMNKNVQILVCNDITVVVVKDTSSHVGPNSPVDLFAVLRIQNPVELIDQTTLRVVDPRHILYLSAASPAQAQEWKAAMTSVHQDSRKASTLL